MNRRAAFVEERVRKLDVNARAALASAVDELQAAAFDVKGELVAYIVPRVPVDEFDTEDLRQHARANLPEPMRPKHYFVLASLPKTLTGKIDHRTLPALEHPKALTASSFVEPRSETESMIASMWTEVLEVEPIGAFDDFFDIGGDSLLATRVVSRIRAKFEIDVTPRALFDAPGLSDLAVLVDELRKNNKA